MERDQYGNEAKSIAIILSKEKRKKESNNSNKFGYQ